MRLFIYPWDLQDEGIDKTLQAIRSWGFDSIAVAVNYHAAKLYLPHNPKRKVYFPEDGCFYLPLPGEGDALRSRNSLWAEQHPSFWDELREAADRCGMKVTAWTIGLHNSPLGRLHPEWAVHNAYGDPYYFSLCPNHVGVRSYQSALLRELAVHPAIDELFLESFQYMDFEHGYHHEMTGVPLSGYAKALLSLCFCEACMKAGSQLGIDMEGLRAGVAAEAEACTAGAEPDDHSSAAAREWLESQGWSDYLAMRQSAVTALVREAAEAVQGKPLIYFSGHPATGWLYGVDHAQLDPYVDCFESYHYAPGTTGALELAAAYAPLITPGKLRLVLRAVAPDVASPAELVERTRVLTKMVEDRWLVGFSLYNYGQVARSHWEHLTTLTQELQS
ncbi:hypothetical protein [Paenibacillus daejeonensis]|uniref:hypothetical protein n=1 Tax=Paenibacillus daejeonensis TaxID=135193 RepID=UPI000382A556|nr:hypothetical protein [Paenibacillus daejeonensis]